MWETPWYEAKGVAQGGTWSWSKKALLAKLRSGSSAKVSKVALAEDGGKVKDDADHG